MKQCLILVIDNDEGVLDVISTVLMQARYKVIPILEVPSIPVTSIKPDLVIVDISRVDSGKEKFFKNLKTDEKTANIPVILTSTASGLDRTAEKWSADAFIYKPFDIDDLTAKVNELLT
jgi:DNA-binding NtrC family response regulator